MSHIELNDVTVEYPIYDSRSRSLKTNLLRHVGGKLVSAGGRMSVKALRNIDLTLRAGDRIGLIGHNGAGKSTLLKVLAGIYEPSGGTVNISGQVSSLLDISMGMDHEATGAENTIMRAVFLGMTYAKARALVPEVEAFCELGEYFYLPMRTYSSGMSLRVAFAVTTAISPEILVMDELISVGDASFAAKAQARLEELIGKAKILALASHNYQTIHSLCNRAVIVESGSIVFDGSVEDAYSLYMGSISAQTSVAAIVNAAANSSEIGPDHASEGSFT
jgi:ABC-type polysaccharide/polyol phosphate transport system ATPase subunit